MWTETERVMRAFRRFVYWWESGTVNGLEARDGKWTLQRVRDDGNYTYTDTLGEGSNLVEAIEDAQERGLE